MMCLLIIGLYYLVGMTISAWMVKSKILVINSGRYDDGEQKFFAYFLVPLLWPLLIVYKIISWITKLHIIIHTILVHTTNVLNMRVTKENGDTVIRFHVPKKSEL